MPCPHCRQPSALVKKGFFSRKVEYSRKVQRFLCRRCHRYSSEQTGTISHGQRRPELHKVVYALLVSGVSQRRIAFLAGTTQSTVARKLVRLSRFATIAQCERLADLSGTVSVSVFDEMETFEHSKCKPLSIAVAVEEGSRYMFGAAVARMPAKGKLAAIARKKYGRRPDGRNAALAKMMAAIAQVAGPDLTVKSDQCPRYPKAVREHLPGAKHVTYKGRRGCVVGQGELKRGGLDPLFSLNQSCAMVRDNLKRMTRRTWCTTKRPDRLQCLLNLYLCFHNALIDKKLSREPPPTGRQLIQLSAGAAM